MSDKREYYKHKYSGSLFLIKAGGRTIMNDDTRLDLLSTINDLVHAGIRVMLIYGGGQAIDEALAKAEITPRKHNGRRITTARTIPIVQSVLAGDLSFRISETMGQIGLEGLCLNNIPSQWADIELRPRDPEDYGYDGTLKNVHAMHIRNLMNTVPFIACPCLGVTAKNAVNINADNVAVALAAGAQFRKLIFLSDVDGVMVDGELASMLTDAEIPALIDSGQIAGGMQIKVESCLYALHHGVRRIHIINGFQEKSLEREMYDTHGIGTMILRESDKDTYIQEIEMEKRDRSNAG